MSEKYLGENSTPLLINQIKENCTQKRSTLPIASIDELGNTYQYTGTTSGSLGHGYFYECVSDGAVTPTYTWQQVNIQPTAGTPTAATTTFDNTTSGLQATNVQGAIDEVVGDLGTASSKDFTTNVSPNNHALVESNAVYSAINNALTSVYTPRGNITCADLTSSLLIASNVGNVYNTTDSGTTTALFMQGAGIPIPQNSTVGIIQTSPNTYLFNLMGNTIDLHDYQKKDLTQAVEGQTTVEGALGALSTNKASKVSNATNGDIATLDANGNLVDSGKTISDVVPLIRIDTTSDSATHGYYKIFEGSTVTASTREVYITGTLHNDSSTPIESSHTQVDLSVRMNKDGASFNGFVSNIPSGFDIIAVGNGTNSYGIYIKAQGAWLKARLKLTVNILGSSSEIIINPTCVASISDSVQTNYSDSWHKVVTENTITNPNLLDNSWFTINQRGLDTYSTPSSGKRFTVDRWAENYHATVVKNTNGVTITSDSSGDNADLGQTIENLYSYLVGKLVTASVMLQNGKIYSKSDVLNANLVGAIRFDLENGFKCDVNTNSSSSYLGFYIYSGANNPNASIAVRAVKLEFGGVSTLAMDCPPNYTTELEKCKRFFEKNSWVSWIPCKAITNGSMMYGFTYRFDVQKRIANWNMTVDSTKGNSNGFLYDLTTGTTIPNSEIVISNSGSYNSRMVQIKITHSSIVAGHEYRYAIGDNVFEISADLS